MKNMHYLKDYQSSGFIIDEVHLDFDLNEKNTRVKSVLKVSRNPKSSSSPKDLILNGEELNLQKLSLNGKPLALDKYELDKNFLKIFSVPQQFTLEIEVIIDPSNNTSLTGLYVSRGNFCSHCEPHGFRWITYFLDRPDIMTRFSTSITADKSRYPYLLSNGNKMHAEDLPNNQHRVVWEDPSLKPCYLFALVAGNFDLLTDYFIIQSGRKIALELYLEKGYADQGAYALESLKRAMRWDEITYGREYERDIYMIVAVSDFNMGAMENKGLNIFNTRFILAKSQTATDEDYWSIASVIGHEYFHNWSGNRVTCRDWFQITLKEGLTVFREAHFLEDSISQGFARLLISSKIRSIQFSEDASPMSHPIRPESYLEVNNFYTPTVYEKGAEVIRMIKTLIGPELFRKGMDLYFSRYVGQAVTTEDFTSVMEEVSGRDLSQFCIWYRQAGTPMFDIEGQYDEKNQKYTLSIKQFTPSTPGQEKKEALHLPLTIGLINSEGGDFLLKLEGESTKPEKEKVLEIRHSLQSFTFLDIKKKPVPSLLRGFSAPVKIRYSYTNLELAILLKNDTDAFSRFNAGQELMLRAILGLVEQGGVEETQIIVESFSILLQKEESDLNAFSYLFRIPTLPYILSNSPLKDVEAIFEARKNLEKKMALALEQELVTAYQQNMISGAYQYSVEDMGKRKLKNIALQYLTATEKQEHQELAFKQFNNSDNMTDVMGALEALNDHESSFREKALSEFYERWKHETLVVKKWLQLQAISTLPQTLNRVHELTQHESFDINNPNKVYALIYPFGENTIRFHEESGAGYEFIADQVIKIDRLNPQVAAYVISSLIKWDTVDQERIERMKMALGRIAQQKNLSSNISEIVMKALS